MLNLEFNVLIIHRTVLTNSVRFDEQSKYAFVGDYSGQISVLRISNTEFSLIVNLKGHSGKDLN